MRTLAQTWQWEQPYEIFLCMRHDMKVADVSVKALAQTLHGKQLYKTSCTRGTGADLRRDNVKVVPAL